MIDIISIALITSVISNYFSLQHRIEKLPDHIANYVPEKSLKDSAIEGKSS